MDRIIQSTLMVLLFLLMHDVHSEPEEHSYNIHVNHGETGGKSYSAVAVGTLEIIDQKDIINNGEIPFFDISANRELVAQYTDEFKDFNLAPNLEQTHSNQAVDISETIYRHVPHEIIKPVPVKVPQKIEIPVPHIVKIPVPKPYPVPYEVVKHIPVSIVKTEKIEVERPVPYEVVKHLPVEVERHVPVPVDRPYEVIKHVKVTIPKEVRIPVDVHKKYPLHIIKHVHHKD